jgi:hypothetical protein
MISGACGEVVGGAGYRAGAESVGAPAGRDEGAESCAGWDAVGGDGRFGVG